ncbi:MULTISPECIES: urease accessory protein [Bradyrhizobium]|uniref:Hydantoin utilization protein A n=3 Tax=Bradyrhizobium TaxID=374 RepID=A0A410VIJ0_9BRAD|nr:MULTISPECIES: urease accessory protein [Bradyrhizobium]MCG2628111.1 urease accessory protein [Bradyrhizobium zhengyangense]MCG2643230.1 urease accessory protein [Bradyrhizobium zhengyangense]MCG2670456.1 urease accessory protein [Bradyrhizobium zhengyangense]MDN4985809.1 urease accessory protein [Bradyrhizobium sp. WYCCWR 13022]MDT4736650.1 urease accessory protein [Bradyrhizobium sp. WYCCWR 12699]
MFGILGLGLLLGMQHALEADHIAAVSSIAARRSDVGEIVKHGLTWGIGHTITLFLFSGAALVLGYAIPPGVSQPLEAAVGFMLILLGSNVIWRLWRERVHVHHHISDFRAPSHKSEIWRPEARAHDHDHGARWRTLAVGLMHGMAGSAALLVLTVSQAPNHLAGILYVLLFGMGSMMGMAALSSLIAVPLVISARTLTWVNRSLQFVIGNIAMGLGLLTIYGTVAAAG